LACCILSDHFVFAGGLSSIAWTGGEAISIRMRYDADADAEGVLRESDASLPSMTLMLF
jgi:hypothetical protein